MAMPHPKSEVASVIGLIGRSRMPLPWQTPDGVPVREVCLLLTPVGQPREAMQALRETVAVLSGMDSDHVEPGPVHDRVGR